MKTLPSDMDIECIELCNLLNSLPTVETMESCCGHCKDEYSIWFYCNSIAVLSRLARSVNKNYSDGKWELLADTCDTKPYGLFWLRSKKPFASSEEMVKSVSALIDNIRYWFDDKFSEYFEKEPTCKKETLKNKLFNQKGITYDAYENDPNPFVGIFFEQLVDIVESIYENIDKQK